jgi:hypothetical protein
MSVSFLCQFRVFILAGAKRSRLIVQMLTSGFQYFTSLITENVSHRDPVMNPLFVTWTILEIKKQLRKLMSSEITDALYTLLRLWSISVLNLYWLRLSQYSTWLLHYINNIIMIMTKKLKNNVEYKKVLSNRQFAV